MLNPLIDEIFELIISGQVWQVHTLASKLKDQGKISTLDSSPERDLFKRNFLIMNALYQLQQQLLPQQHLRVSTLHIELVNESANSRLQISGSLRDYYLDWQNFETSSADIDELLNQFWQRFGHIKQPQTQLNSEQRTTLLRRWKLADDCTIRDVQKRWRQLAIKHHPDKAAGDAEQFKILKNEYEQLKVSCSITKDELAS